MRWVYALLAGITGPLGGAVAGYFYAQKSRELAALQGREDNTLLHNPLFAAATGAALGFLGPFVGFISFLGCAAFGFAYGNKEQEVAQLRNDIVASNATRGYPPVMGYGPAREMGGAYWRDRLNAENQARTLDR